MSIHIIFRNGGNPFIRYSLSPEEFARELLRWSDGYKLEFLKATDETIFHFEATEKERK